MYSRHNAYRTSHKYICDRLTNTMLRFYSLQQFFLISMMSLTEWNPKICRKAKNKQKKQRKTHNEEGLWGSVGFKYHRSGESHLSSAQNKRTRLLSLSLFPLKSQLVCCTDAEVLSSQSIHDIIWCKCAQNRKLQFWHATVNWAALKYFCHVYILYHQP